jgi:hypothetical protein
MYFFKFLQLNVCNIIQVFFLGLIFSFSAFGQIIENQKFRCESLKRKTHDNPSVSSVDEVPSLKNHANIDHPICKWDFQF